MSDYERSKNSKAIKRAGPYGPFPKEPGKTVEQAFHDATVGTPPLHEQVPLKPADADKQSECIYCGRKWKKSDADECPSCVKKPADAENAQASEIRAFTRTIRTNKYLYSRNMHEDLLEACDIIDRQGEQIKAKDEALRRVSAHAEICELCRKRIEQALQGDS